MADASTVVAKPLKSAPTITTGSSSSHLASQIAAPASAKANAGRCTSLARAVRIPHAAVMPMSSRPGTMPPMNRSSIGDCATMPYRIRGSAGGSSRPSEPDAVSRPSENFSP